MNRMIWLWPTALVVGCSTSPCADFLDHFWPAKPPSSAAGSFGGVCNPTPTGPGVSGGGPVMPNNPPPLMNTAPGTGPVVVPPTGTGTVPNPNTPYIPGAASPPPLSNLPAPPLNGMPTSSPSPGGNEAQPLPAPPSSTAPPF